VSQFTALEQPKIFLSSRTGLSIILDHDIASVYSCRLTTSLSSPAGLLPIFLLAFSTHHLVTSTPRLLFSSDHLLLSSCAAGVMCLHSLYPFALYCHNRSKELDSGHWRRARLFFPFFFTTNLSEMLAKMPSALFARPHLTFLSTFNSHSSRHSKHFDSPIT
jgi:hypothetical protein